MVPLKWIEYGVCGDLIVMYPKPYSIYLRGSINPNPQLESYSESELRFVPSRTCRKFPSRAPSLPAISVNRRCAVDLVRAQVNIPPNIWMQGSMCIMMVQQ